MPDARSFITKHSHRLVGLLRNHDLPASAHDAGLLARNLPHGAAQHLGVLQADVGQDRQQRVGKVHRVEPATDANLHHGNVDTLLLKPATGHRREGFKAGGQAKRRRIPRVDDMLDAVCKIQEGRFRHQAEIACRCRGEALNRCVQMRACEHTGVHAGSGQNRRQHRHCAALALRAGDDDAARGGVWRAAKPLQEMLRARDALTEVILAGVLRRVNLVERLDELNCRF